MELHVQARKGFPGFHLEADFATSGERIGLFGKSGGGKSTIAALLAGLIQPDDGSGNGSPPNCQLRWTMPPCESWT